MADGDALTDEERERMNLLIEVARHKQVTADELGESDGTLALVRVEHNGVPRAAVVLVSRDGETFHMDPLALLIDDALLAEITPPEGALAGDDGG